MDIFLIENYDLLEKYNTTWDKVTANIRKSFDSKPVYNKIFLKTITKFYGDEVTDFYDEEIPKVDYNYTCLAVFWILDNQLGFCS